jgi:hypothetical protein
VEIPIRGEKVPKTWSGGLLPGLSDFGENLQDLTFYHGFLKKYYIEKINLIEKGQKIGYGRS